ncbi:MAG: hypothetical protein WA917_02735 [Comamonas sp.]
MKTSSTTIFGTPQRFALNHWAVRHKFWLGAASGAFVAVGLTAGWDRLATLGALSTLLAVLPCALMMGLCMKMMKHTDSNGASCSGTQPEQAAEPASLGQTGLQAPQIGLSTPLISEKDHA